jgi:histidine phosphotransferase ChpT
MGILDAPLTGKGYHNMSESLRLSQLVCSRLCHDLVGAAGAINAGLEILAEIGELDDSALELATSSGQEMTRRLAFYRVAFGAGGAGNDGADINMLRKLAAEFLESGNVDLNWPEDANEVSIIDPMFAKLLLNVILIAAECLPRGGVVDVRVVGMDNGTGMAVSAEGTDAGLREDIAQAMTPGEAVENISSRSIHAFVTQLLVLETGSELEVAADNGAVRFAAVYEE